MGGRPRPLKRREWLTRSDQNRGAPSAAAASAVLPYVSVVYGSFPL
jgi:hypothetical protein